MTPLDDLIARLEAATEGSRELDAEIAALCHLTDDPQYAAFENGRDYPDLYTRSVDAAMTLVPEDEGFAIETRTGSAGERPMPRAWVSRHDDEPCIPNIAATPALALCIACLRAIAASRGKR